MSVSFNPHDYSDTPMTLHKVGVTALNRAAGPLAKAHYHDVAALTHAKLADNAPESRIAAFHNARADKHEDQVIANVNQGRINTTQKTGNLRYDFPGYSRYMDN